MMVPPCELGTRLFTLVLFFDIPVIINTIVIIKLDPPHPMIPLPSLQYNKYIILNSTVNFFRFINFFQGGFILLCNKR